MEWADSKIMALSPDAASVVTGHTNGYLRRWDLESGKLLEQQKISDGSIETLVSRPQANQLIVHHRGKGEIYCFEQNSFSEPVRILHHDSWLFAAVQLNSNGSRLVSKSSTGEEYIWDLQTGELLARSHYDEEAGSPGAITDDGQTLISGTEPGSILLSRTADMHRPTGWFEPLPGFERAMLSPNSQTMIYLGDNKLRISSFSENFDPDTSQFVDFEMEKLPNQIVWSEDYKGIVCFNDQRISAFAIREARWQKILDKPHGEFNLIDGKIVALSDSVSDEESQFELDENFVLTRPRRVIWQGTRCIVLTRGNVLIETQFSDSEELQLKYLGRNVVDIAQSTSGLAWIDEEGIHCGKKFNNSDWDVAPTNDGALKKLTWSDDGKLLLASRQSGAFLCLNPENGELIWEGYGHNFPLHKVVCTPDLKYLLTIDDLGDAFIHDLQQHRPIAKINQTTSPFVGACFVDNNGRLLMLNKALSLIHI